MNKYRKKPVVIEAVQFTDRLVLRDAPTWFVDACAKGGIRRNGNELRIMTLEDGADGEAKHVASLGDWIIQGIKGELYACKPDIFEATYEAVS